MTRSDGITVFGPEDLLAIDEVLGTFARETGARCAALIDRSGRLLTLTGETGAMDRITFASLVAGDFAASGQLASLLGEQEFSSLYHHGDGRSMFLADVSGWAILAALFDGRTTLGMIRLKTRTVVPKLVALFEQLAARGPVAVDSPIGQGGWAAEAESEIDRLFSE